MDELLHEWEDWMRAGSAAHLTIKTRLTGIRTLCRHAGTDDPVSLTTRQIIRWLSDCDARWTRCTYATTARAWHRWLVQQGHRVDNPMDGVPMPKQPRSTARPAPSSVVRDVIDGAPRKARAYIVLGTFLGLRVHEIAKVRGEEFIDGWYFAEGKGGDVEGIPTHPLVEQLRRGYPETGFWFPGATDGHVAGSAVGCTISAAFTRRGHHITAHQLRHWYGTHAQRVGKDSRVTQRLMRHASLQSTQIYTEVADQGMVETVRRLAV